MFFIFNHLVIFLDIQYSEWCFFSIFQLIRDTTLFQVTNFKLQITNGKNNFQDSKSITRSKIFEC